MEILDGLYRYGGTLVTWDRHGVSLTRADQRGNARVAWEQIADVRRVGVEAGFLQLVLRGDANPDYRTDPVAFEVSSEQDANRLTTSIRWYAAAAARTSGRRKPTSRLTGWRERRRRMGSPGPEAACG